MPINAFQIHIYFYSMYLLCFECFVLLCPVGEGPVPTALVLKGNRIHTYYSMPPDPTTWTIIST